MSTQRYGRSLSEMIADPRPIAGGDGEGQGGDGGSGTGGDGGQQSGGAGDGSQGGAQGGGGASQISREEHDAATSRLSREAKTHREAKEAAEKKLADLEKKDQSDVEKAKTEAQTEKQRADAAETKLVELQRDHLVERVAIRLKARDPEVIQTIVSPKITASKLEDLDEKEVEKEIKALLKSKPWLAEEGEGGEGDGQGSEGSGGSEGNGNRTNPDRTRTSTQEDVKPGIGRIRNAFEKASRKGS